MTPFIQQGAISYGASKIDISIKLSTIAVPALLALWIVALLMTTWILFRLNERRYRFASAFVALVATILSVVVPLALFKPENSTEIHWDRLVLVVGGAFSISWITSRILARRSRLQVDTEVFE